MAHTNHSSRHRGVKNETIFSMEIPIEIMNPRPKPATSLNTDISRFRTVDVDIPKGPKPIYPNQEEYLHHRLNVAYGHEKKPQEFTRVPSRFSVPTISLETRKLLQEVENLKMRQQPLLDEASICEWRKSRERSATTSDATSSKYRSYKGSIQKENVDSTSYDLTSLTTETTSSKSRTATTATTSETPEDSTTATATQITTSSKTASSSSSSRHRHQRKRKVVDYSGPSTTSSHEITSTRSGTSTSETLKTDTQGQSKTSVDHGLVGGSSQAKSPKLELQDIAVQTDAFEIPRRSRPRIRFRPNNQLESQGLRTKSESSLTGIGTTKTPRSPYHVRSKSEDSSFDWKEHRQQLREKREHEKPWRNNMMSINKKKKKDEGDGKKHVVKNTTPPPLQISKEPLSQWVGSNEPAVLSNIVSVGIAKADELPHTSKTGLPKPRLKDVTVTVPDTTYPKSSTENERTSDTKEPDSVQVQKPWRCNMKVVSTNDSVDGKNGTKSSMYASEERQKLWESNPEVQKYMVEKRLKAKHEEQKREKEMTQRDESIRKRLLALEMKRREDYKRVLLLKESSSMPHLPQPEEVNDKKREVVQRDQPKVPSEKIETKYAVGHSTKDEQDPLDWKKTLQELTIEMRQKKALLLENVQKRPCREHGLGHKQPEKAGRNKDASISKREARNDTLSSECDLPERDPNLTAQDKSQKLKVTVSEMFERHQRDLEAIKNANLGIELPDSSQLLSKFKPNRPALEATTKIPVEPKIRMMVPSSPPPESSSESDLPSPKDSLNFLSSVRRKEPLVKLESQNQGEKPKPVNTKVTPTSRGTFRGAEPHYRQHPKDDDIPSVNLSEGPLSTSMSSLGDNHDGQIILADHLQVNPCQSPRVIHPPANPLPNIGTTSEPHQALSTSSELISETRQQEKKRGPRSTSHMNISDALKLRFRVEMDHLESMSEVDRQLNQLQQIKDISSQKIKSADLASYLQSLQREAKKSGDDVKRSESRADFEARLRTEFRAILDKKMYKLVEKQAEAATLTANAAEQLARLQIGESAPRGARSNVTRQTNSNSTSVSSSSSIGASSVSCKPKHMISPRLKTMMSHSSTKISEVLSAIEETEKSSGNIPRTISEALGHLSSADEISSSGHNITEAISKELSEYSSKFEEESTASTTTAIQEDNKSSTRSSRSLRSKMTAKKGTDLDSSESSQLFLPSKLKNLAQLVISEGEDDSFHALTRTIERQQLEEESLRSQQQYQILKRKEYDLVEKAKSELLNLKDERRKVKNDAEKVNSLKRRERAILLDLDKKRKEINRLKKAIKLGEKERKIILKQHKMLYKLSSSSTTSKSKSVSNKTSNHEDDDSLVTDSESPSQKQDPPKAKHEGSFLEANTQSSSIVLDADSTLGSSSDSSSHGSRTRQGNGSERRRSSVPQTLSSPSKMDSLKKSFGSLKTPLSPKLSQSRRRHSSADSDESMSLSQADTISDHSDVDIRIQTLQDELKRRMATASKLKRQQRLKKKEKLRIQETTLKKQIEQYDKLIEETRADLHDETTKKSNAPHVPPQIKTPKLIASPTLTSPTPSYSKTDSFESSPPVSLGSEEQSQALSQTSPSQQDTTIMTSSKATNQVEEEENKQAPKASPLGCEMDVPVQGVPPPEVEIPPIQDKQEDDQSEYSDDFTLSNANSETEIDEVQTETPQVQSHEGPSLSLREDEEASRLDLITDHILELLIADACESLGQVRKTSSSESQRAIKPRDSDVRIGPKPRTRPQDLMLTTFDISSESSSDEAVVRTVPTVDIDPKKTAQFSHEDQHEELPAHGSLNFNNGINVNNNSNNDNGDDSVVAAFHGNFIDDDFGLTSIAQESEKIRLQQLEIEAEIQRIQEESARAVLVPENPPPPYTPPPVAIQSPDKDKPIKAVVPGRRDYASKGSKAFVPTTQEELAHIARAITEAIFNSRTGITWERETLLSHLLSISVPNQERITTTATTTTSTSSSSTESRRVFLNFLIDLIQEIVTNIYQVESESQNPPWLPPKPIFKERFKAPKDLNSLWDRVQKEIWVHFGFQKRAQKENLIVRWSQKRRDRVDHILVRELHAEEATWTDYNQDEAIVKDQLASAIWTILIEDTAKRVSEVYNNTVSPLM
ncbi:hypothetical protein TCAL_11660 [Tigriopus californicus]|uniref:CAP-Gly domain-containing protein n=2 Tax=Tigriopus californicus TaxID=6832 RepID=A0A553NCI4_TIGCA|nr:uncharacterized protein LOC131889299 isoform X2 [Tigriopus californicus]TRY63156.1 hypothetical protein TCAL_11660 [Tigriopus californicus]|eukprot:TCALIF_11660-PA protein Name:"Similar to CEP350 Centrosome-associated protein 350 (Homo sapiens)" AED:0.00 eAED:0.00 QI:24/1/1/1/0.6/0.72/11/39/2124